jgi:hypothetical protein
LRYEGASRSIQYARNGWPIHPSSVSHGSVAGRPDKLPVVTLKPLSAWYGERMGKEVFSPTCELVGI